MNVHEIFKAQVEKGATEMFWYGVERKPENPESIEISMMRHKGTLDSFPSNLVFVHMIGETTSTPLFKEVEQ